MSFLSRLFKKKKEEAPEPPRPIQPAPRPSVKPAPASPSSDKFATVKSPAPADLREPTIAQAVEMIVRARGGEPKAVRREVERALCGLLEPGQEDEDVLVVRGRKQPCAC